jgi:hypothetical protein
MVILRDGDNQPLERGFYNIRGQNTVFIYQYKKAWHFKHTDGRHFEIKNSDYSRDFYRIHNPQSYLKELKEETRFIESKLPYLAKK